MNEAKTRITAVMVDLMVQMYNYKTLS